MHTTAASLALCAIERPHLAQKLPFARTGPKWTALRTGTGELRRRLHKFEEPQWLCWQQLAKGRRPPPTAHAASVAICKLSVVEDRPRAVSTCGHGVGPPTAHSWHRASCGRTRSHLSPEMAVRLRSRGNLCTRRHGACLSRHGQPHETLLTDALAGPATWHEASQGPRRSTSL